jgi:hypothetical protein
LEAAQLEIGCRENPLHECYDTLGILATETWIMLGKTGQTNQVIQRTDDLKLPEIQQDWVKVDISRQGGSSRDLKAKLSLLTLYLAIQCHMLSIIKSMSSQHKELKVGKRENVAK